MISHSIGQGSIHCCSHCPLTVKAAPVTKSACQKAVKDHRAATSLGQLPHGCLAAGTGTSQLEPQQPLQLLEELLAATQQVKEWSCVSRCNVPHDTRKKDVPHDILLPCHDRNPLLACLLGLQRHAHSLHHAVAGLTGGTNCAYGQTCTLLCCLGVRLVYSVGVITDVMAYWQMIADCLLKMIAYSDTLLLLCAEAPLLVHTANHGVAVCNHFILLGSYHSPVTACHNPLCILAAC